MPWPLTCDHKKLNRSVSYHYPYIHKICKWSDKRFGCFCTTTCIWRWQPENERFISPNPSHERDMYNYMANSVAMLKLWGSDHRKIVDAQYQTRILNSLAPGSNLKSIIFKFIIQNYSLGTYSWITLRWMPQNIINEKSTLVQVMAWGHQATSHYLSQWWPSSTSPSGITRSQWVKQTQVWMSLLQALSMPERVNDKHHPSMRPCCMPKTCIGGMDK